MQRREVWRMKTDEKSYTLLTTKSVLSLHGVVQMEKKKPHVTDIKGLNSLIRVIGEIDVSFTSGLDVLVDPWCA